MKYVFTLELETNGEFDFYVNKEVEDNRKIDPTITFEQQALEDLVSMIEYNVSEDGVVENVKATLVKTIE